MENTMTHDEQKPVREAFGKYAIKNNLIRVGSDNLATGVRHLDSHRDDFFAGYEASTTRESELLAVIRAMGLSVESAVDQISSGGNARFVMAKLANGIADLAEQVV